MIKIKLLVKLIDFTKDLKKGINRMNWLTNFVKPKLSALVKRKDVPDKSLAELSFMWTYDSS